MSEMRLIISLDALEHRVYHMRLECDRVSAGLDAISRLPQDASYRDLYTAWWGGAQRVNREVLKDLEEEYENRLEREK